MQLIFPFPDLLVCLFVLFVLRLNVPVNNFSVMSGRSHRFLGNQPVLSGSKVSCSRTQHGGGRFRTPDLSLQSPTLYHWATALPRFTCILSNTLVLLDTRMANSVGPDQFAPSQSEVTLFDHKTVPKLTIITVNLLNYTLIAKFLLGVFSTLILKCLHY